MTRGTAMSVDWLTNLNIGMQLGPSSHLVHAGFHEVWKSFRDTMRTQIFRVSHHADPVPMIPLFASGTSRTIATASTWRGRA